MVTPHQELTLSQKDLGLNQKVYAKREDMHPYGSHKGRSIPVMIEEGIKKGHSRFVLSSSGNAALAALRCFEKLQEKPETKTIALVILVGKKIPSEKLLLLHETLHKVTNCTVEQVDRPLQSLKNYEAEGYYSLRQSTDDTSLIGYGTLAEELLTIPNLKHVFLPCSSGTTAQALAQYFSRTGKEITLHLAQTSSCHPFFDSVNGHNQQATDEISIADAIVDIVGHRKPSLLPFLSNKQNSVGIISNEEITLAMLMLSHESINVSPNGALAFALLQQSLKSKWEPCGSVAILICGR